MRGCSGFFEQAFWPTLTSSSKRASGQSATRHRTSFPLKPGRPPGRSSDSSFPDPTSIRPVRFRMPKSRLGCTRSILMRRLYSLALATALFAVTPAIAADGKSVKLVHCATGKVMAVLGDTAESGARSVLAKDELVEARRWRVETDGPHVRLIHVKSGRVLDVYENSTEDGAPIIIWNDKNGAANQLWVWDAKGGEGRLVSKLSGLVLDVDAKGLLIQRKADSKARSQLWRTREVMQ